MTEDILKRLNGYNESRARMGDGEYALCVDAAEEIAKLRALLSRWVKAVAHHKLSAEKAERERDDLRAEVERWVKEVAHLKLAAEKAERDDDSSVLLPPVFGYVRVRWDDND